MSDGAVDDGTVRELAVESEAFGVAVAHVGLDGATPERLEGLEGRARALGARCLLGELNPERSHAVVLVQDHGWRLAETNITLRRRAGAARAPRTPPPGLAVVDDHAEGAVAALGDLVEPLLRWQGPTHDPHLGPGAARRLLGRHLADAAARDGARLLVALGDDGPAGFATVVTGPTPRLSLLSVRRPGDGTSDALVGRVLADAEGDVDAGPVASGDLHGLRSLERMGFMMATSRYRYHRWPEEGAT